VDLGIESIEHPERFPLVAKLQDKGNSNTLDTQMPFNQQIVIIDAFFKTMMEENGLVYRGCINSSTDCSCL
jgi:hypothetical protein